MMDRRNFIQRLLLTLLVCLFGPRVMELLDSGEFDKLVDKVVKDPVEFRIRGRYQLMCRHPGTGVEIIW